MKNIYYLLKPVIPWRIRMRLRRILSTRLRRQHRNTWPIQEAAARPPEGWPGWPNVKKFAFVLTHDVEGTRGLVRCRRLADIDKALGVGSSFNFVPEGEYRVPEKLRTFLEEEGFEVGVHDLYHDGSLYRSLRQFKEQAVKINQHLKTWKALGFRSGFMLHNLDWIQELDIRYDASTFDTDPFEPQPDGVGTIFPFRVQGDGSKGMWNCPIRLHETSLYSSS